MFGPTDPSTRLLLEEARVSPDHRALVLSTGDPNLALGVAELVKEVYVVDASFASLQRLLQRIKVARVKNISVVASAAQIAADLSPFPEQSCFDVAFLIAPKGRDAARNSMYYALKALCPQGKLYLAGRNEGGIKSLADDAEALFGHCVTLSTRNRHRVCVSKKEADTVAYPTDWGDPDTMQARLFETPFGELDLVTAPGVFSWEHLDEGTGFLLENFAFEPGQLVLDMCCGYGIIGLIAARQAERVVMVDENLLAVACAHTNLEMSNITNAQALASDVYSELQGQKFDLIISNPPFHQEFDVNTNVPHRIMRDAHRHLYPGGRLVMVCNAFLRYDKVLDEYARQVRVIANDNKYMIIEGTF